MEAYGTGVGYAYDRIKQALRLETDRGSALRQAIVACRKGGTLVVLGVYGLIDKFPLGVIMNKGMTLRSAQEHGQNMSPDCSNMPFEVSSTPRCWQLTASHSKNRRVVMHSLKPKLKVAFARSSFRDARVLNRPTVVFGVLCPSPSSQARLH